MLDKTGGFGNEQTSPELVINGKIATIYLRRPSVSNRLSPSDLDTLRAHIHSVNASEDVLVLRLVSSGKYFCSGYDISSLSNDAAPSSLYFGETVNMLEEARPVTIAAIQGGAYGGGTDLCLACDFRIGTKQANMFMPAARLGLSFYAGGMQRYISRLGLNEAKRLFLTAEKIHADEMLRIGFLTELVSEEQLAARTDELSNLLASMAPIALLQIKRDMNQIIKHQLDPEANACAVLHSETSEDIREGTQAWKEKRAPQFRGK